MSEHVWISLAAGSVQNHFQFGWPDSYGTNTEIVSLINQMRGDFRAGTALDSSRFPDALETSMESDAKYKLPRNLPPYVNWTCPVLERPIVDVMQSFDLGGSNFYPVKMRRLDKDQIYDQDFSILNIAAAKQTLVPAQSGSAIEENPFVPGLFKPETYAEDDQIAVHQACVAGPDIWVDPTIMNGCFFVSDRLRVALDAADLAASLQLRRCRIADDQTETA